MVLSLFQWSPAECGVSECDREALTMRRPWSFKGSRAIKEENKICDSYIVIQKASNKCQIQKSVLQTLQIFSLFLFISAHFYINAFCLNISSHSPFIIIIIYIE
jgi:hypothetical protein